MNDSKKTLQTGVLFSIIANKSPRNNRYYTVIVLPPGLEPRSVA